MQFILGNKMRFRQPNIGDKRIRSFFALFPVRCYTTNEIRWMETVTVLEKYVQGIGPGYWAIEKFND
jgi:hypothetical protein